MNPQTGYDSEQHFDTRGYASVPSKPSVSLPAALVAVGTAFTVGLIASLALRPPSTVMESGAALPESGPTREIQWRVSSAFAANLPIIGEVGIFVADTLNSMSDGSMEFRVYDPGELMPAFAISEAVRDEKIAAGYTWAGYDQGRIPAASLIASVPFGLEPLGFMAWWYHAGGRDLGEELYAAQNIHPVLCGLIGPETAGWFRKPIDSIEDFRGLKIRFSGLGGRVLQSLGSSVTIIPGGEIFQALEKGAIDATEFSQPTIDAMLGFDRVARYNYFPGWHQTFSSFHLFINLDVWKALSKTQRAMIDGSCMAGVVWSLARSEALQGEALMDMADRGVESRMFSQQILNQLREATSTVLEQEAAADESFARILRHQQAFTRQYETWKHRAYVGH